VRYFVRPFFRHVFRLLFLHWRPLVLSLVIYLFRPFVILFCVVISLFVRYLCISFLRPFDISSFRSVVISFVRWLFLYVFVAFVLSLFP